MSLLTEAWGSMGKNEFRDFRSLEDCFVHFATNAEWREHIFQRPWKDAWHKRWYLAYVLRSTAWKKKREACIERSNQWCEICRKALAVQAHHLTYKRLGDEADEDLQAVCVTCHRKEHRNP
jgi:hypothetical protein